MSPGPDVQLRELVFRAESLAEALASVRRNGRNGHQLGIGIKARRTYATSTGYVHLPTYGEGLKRLKSVVSEPVLSLDAQMSRAAWHAVLDQPELILPVTVSWEALLTDQITVDQAQLPRVRRVVLARVLRQGSETLSQGVLASSRLAGIAVLTVLMHSNGRGVENGWMTGIWLESTRALVTALDPIFAASGRAPRKDGTRVGLLIPEKNNSLVPVEAVDQLKRSASFSGLTLEIHRHSGGAHANVAATIAGRRPSHLLVLGSDPSVNPIREAFEIASALGRADLLTAVTVEDALASIREKFATLVDVAPSLHPLIRIDRPLVVESLPQMPITPTRCLHHGSNVYIEDGENSMWWTRDFANHGTTIFKTYTRSATHLIFESDRDEGGARIVGKHKGEQGLFLPLTEMVPCSHPDSHVKSKY